MKFKMQFLKSLARIIRHYENRVASFKSIDLFLNKLGYSLSKPSYSIFNRGFWWRQMAVNFQKHWSVIFKSTVVLKNKFSTFGIRNIKNREFIHHLFFYKKISTETQPTFSCSNFNSNKKIIILCWFQTNKNQILSHGSGKNDSISFELRQSTFKVGFTV